MKPPISNLFQPILISTGATRSNVAMRCASADRYLVWLKLDWRGALRTPHWRVLVSSSSIDMADLSVFVFQCDDTDIHALSLYRSGDNLPAHACPGAWRYRGRLLMNTQSLATLPLDVSAAIAELKANGVFLARFRSGIIIFPR